ncbi:MAG: N-acetylneuraminate synthase family protein [Myxococcota bacterium]
MALEIIAELHPQHGGDMGAIREYIRVAAERGADVAKFQLYDAEPLLGSDKWNYLQLSFEDTKTLKRWCEQDEIEFMASVFDEERLGWCEELGVERYKLASRTVAADPKLCDAILATRKPVIASLGMWKEPHLPFGSEHEVRYLFCRSDYPAFLENIPDFPGDFPGQGLAGYSDHTLGIDACLLAIARGAHVIEKHFSLNKLGGKPTEKAHICSMTPDELQQLRTVGTGLHRAYRLLSQR